ncbi:hypothetical protein Bca52824_017959 [Brassica carinata]|uniref:Uncharacterized protein n=1 Tax=Brassica carinata TaxID=52824 RepID=A0A8X7VPI1_BRACI|nr:hypothetical protein Bca52824_017959 [Brassica carinata]
MSSKRKSSCKSRRDCFVSDGSSSQFNDVVPKVEFEIPLVNPEDREAYWKANGGVKPPRPGIWNPLLFRANPVKGCPTGRRLAPAAPTWRPDTGLAPARRGAGLAAAPRPGPAATQRAAGLAPPAWRPAAAGSEAGLAPAAPGLAPGGLPANWPSPARLPSRAAWRPAATYPQAAWRQRRHRPGPAAPSAN